MRLFWDGFSGYTRTSVIIISPLRSVDPPQIEFPLYNCHCRLDDITFLEFYLLPLSTPFLLLPLLLLTPFWRGGRRKGEKKRQEKYPRLGKRTHEEAISPDQIYYVSR